ncbi:hypothetical protein MMC22_004743 [Lobaria immixta]|nr:hypothetical protein [Lobaria immixta]
MDAIKVELQSLTASGQIFLVIDALDECPIGDQGESRAKVLALLTELSGWALPNLHVLVTSRKEQDNDKALASLLSFPSISIQTDQVQPDVRKYVKSQLANDLELKKWSSLIKEEIEKTLTEQAHGMFRWVVCQIDSLKRYIFPRDIRDVLKDLPKTLDDFYARSLRGIDESYRQMTLRALQWLTFSKRPLSIEELAEVVLIDPQATPSFDRTERLFHSHDILRVLSSLATVHTLKPWDFHADTRLENQEIRLAHFSVKEYLISKRPKPAELSQFNFTQISADHLIAQSSLLYMKSLAEMEEKCWSRGDLVEFPLLRYACRL